MREKILHLTISLAMVLLTSLTLDAQIVDGTNAVFNLSKSTNNNVKGYDKNYNIETQIRGNIIHTVWRKFDTQYNHKDTLVYRRSINLGKTWEKGIKFAVPENSSLDKRRMTKLTVNDNKVNVYYVRHNESGKDEIVMAKSVDSGATFSDFKVIFTGKGIYSCFAKAVGDNIAIAFRETIAIPYKETTYPRNVLVSVDNGKTFTKKKITLRNDDIIDMHYDGNQIVVLTGTRWGPYNIYGRANVLVSNDNGDNFIDHDISYTWLNDEGTKLYKSRNAPSEESYRPKIATQGDYIYLVTGGLGKDDEGKYFLIRSTDRGNTFETPMDITSKPNGGHFAVERAFIKAKGNNVYVTYSNFNSKYEGNHDRSGWLVNSSDNGATIKAIRKMNDDKYKNNGFNWMDLTFDSSDASGNTLYITNYLGVVQKSTDGGATFDYNFYLPNLPPNETKWGRNPVGTKLLVDNNKKVHLFTRFTTNDGMSDYYYTKDIDQPEPGKKDKVFKLAAGKYNSDMALINPSPTLKFDSVMSCDFWIRIDSTNNAGASIFENLKGRDSNKTKGGFYMGLYSYYYGENYLNFYFYTENENKNIKIKPYYKRWQHVAITYDARVKNEDNVFIYINGIVVGKMKTTEKLKFGEGLWQLGVGSYLDKNDSYSIDDFRLWDRVLTQDELFEYQNKKMPTNKDGLKLWLNFDDTFKDVSGNGNDARPLYNCAMVDSDIDPLFVDFDIVNNHDMVSFDNKTKKGAYDFEWDFGPKKIDGDNERKTQQYPERPYDEPGKHLVSLKAKNNTTTGACKKNINVRYFKNINTNIGGGGKVTVNISASDLSNKTKVTLRPVANGSVINAEKVVALSDNKLKATFDLTNKTIGYYDVELESPSVSTLIRKRGFKVIKSSTPPVVTTNIGARAYRAGRWTQQEVYYMNSGYYDSTPKIICVAVSNNIKDLKFKNIKFDFPEAYPDGMYEKIKNEKKYFVFDDIPGIGKNIRVYPIMLPTVRANGVDKIKFDVLSDENYTIGMFVMEGMYYDSKKTGTKSAFSDYNLCIAAAIGKLTITKVADIVADNLPAVGCAKDVLSLAQTILAPEEGEAALTCANAASGFVATVLSCASKEIPITKGLKVAYEVINLVGDINGVYQDHKECEKYRKKDLKKEEVESVVSFDPNHIVGPKGYAHNKYIKGAAMPYTIGFENKKTATAAAQEVVVIDTLDAEKLNIQSFQFQSFGYGDKHFDVEQSDFAFSKTIDLRPKQNLLLRVSGSVDTLNNVVRWHFISLDPKTKALTTDALAGFLPPNVNAPEGEGYVTFTISPKEELPDGANIANKATIIFDLNEPIITNTWRNVTDIKGPESKAISVKQLNEKGTVELEFIGDDNGAGIRDLNLYVAEGEGEFVNSYSNLKVGEKLKIDLKPGKFYQFYTLATDSLDNEELMKSAAEVSITLTKSATGVALDKTSVKIAVGETKQITAAVKPDDATDKTVAWSSSNTNIATVDAKGLVSAVATGVATITATTKNGGHTATCKVTVTQQVTGISISKTAIELKAKETMQLTVTVEPDNATNKKVVWSSSDTNIATVDAKGLVTAIAPNIANITATSEDGGHTATCVVTVKQVTAIDDIELLETKVWGANGAINIHKAPVGERLDIYNFSGMLILSKKIENSSDKININTGMYIVLIKNMRYKVVVVE